MTIEWIRPEPNERVTLLPDGQRALLGGARVGGGEADWRNPALDGAERSFPLPVRFAWRASEPLAAGARVELRLRACGAEGEVAIPATGCEAEADNLLAGCRYEWRVVVFEGECAVCESPAWRFSTAPDAPRLIRVDGLTNVRDVGGWKTASGRAIRQGLAFRGSEMDTHHALTEAGRRTLVSELGIVTDLDLRGEAAGKIERSPMGEGVRFRLIPVRAYGEFFEEGEKGACRAVFSLLAERESYPLYMHCWGGADRTGTVALLLGALLGMEDESLLLDYELTSFAIWGVRSRESELFRSLLSALDRYGAPDEPLRRKAERYLRDCGVTAEQTNAIRDIFLEE